MTTIIEGNVKTWKDKTWKERFTISPEMKRAIIIGAIEVTTVIVVSAAINAAGSYVSGKLVEHFEEKNPDQVDDEYEEVEE